MFNFIKIKMGVVASELIECDNPSVFSVYVILTYEKGDAL